MAKMLSPAIFEYIARNTHSGVYVIDREQKIVFWNSGAERITGYLQQEMLGRTCQDNLLIHCDKEGILLCGDGCPAEAAMKDGRIVDACVLTHHKQGHRIPILVRAIPLRDEKGAVVGAAACFDRQAIPEVSGATENETFLPLDENTGLPDKDFSYTFLAAKLRRLTPDSRRFTVVRFEMAELENLRKSLGKEAIPAILKPLAETLKAAIRPPDYLGMWNNAGFLMVLGTGRDNPPEITSLRYKNLAEATSISWWGDRLIPITNVKATIAQAGDTVESLIARLNKMP